VLQPEVVLLELELALAPGQVSEPELGQAEV